MAAEDTIITASVAAKLLIALFVAAIASDALAVATTSLMVEACLLGILRGSEKLLGRATSDKFILLGSVMLALMVSLAGIGTGGLPCGRAKVRPAMADRRRKGVWKCIVSILNEKVDKLGEDVGSGRGRALLF